MYDTTNGDVVEHPAALTTAWLTTTLAAGPVTGFGYERIGTGQVSECYRVRLEYAAGTTGPATVVLKVAAADPVSRRTGHLMGLYDSEVRFYREIAPHVADGPIAPCHHAAIDTATGAFDLLIDDVTDSVVGDEIHGATIEQALVACRELGRMHALLLRRPELAEAAWLDRGSILTGDLLSQLYDSFLDRYHDALTAEHRAVCDPLVAAYDTYVAEVGRGRTGLIHGDYRMDNLLFGKSGAARPLTVVDWQGVMSGPAQVDLAYFLGCALPTTDRRAHYDELLTAYHAALGPDSPSTLGEVRQAVRAQSFMGVIMAVTASMVVERTPRGDELFLTTLDRHCAHVRDTGALDLLPGTSGRSVNDRPA
ncbi:phosphotransferase [Nocardia sp. NPDC052254]|uniref:phosphotransferase n=1 Tax=Nocardia sp. NPDC052254 TaxID=3155681 RepID=UPI003440CE6A